MQPRTAPGAGAAISFLAAGTSFFTLLSWQGLADDSSAFLVPLFWVAVLVATLGLGLRTIRVPTLLIPAVQVFAVGALVHQYVARGGAVGGWVPTPASLESVGSQLRGAVEAASRYAAPIPTSAPEFAALMLLCGVAVILLVDLFACTLRRVPLAGLPLLAAFTAPVSLLGGVSWLSFALAAICFIFLLAADQAVRLGQWGRSLSGPVTDSQPHTVGLATVWPTATRLGFAGIGLAVLAPALIPATSSLLDGGNGPGSGGGGDEVTLDNPMVDLRRDLRRGADVPMLRFTTDDPNPAYLRLSVLDEFTGAAWVPADRDLPVANRVDGPLPTAPGLAPSTPRTEHTWSISVEDTLKSTWLPIPYPATSVQVEGDWRYDEDTLDLRTLTPGLNTAGLSYKVVGVTVQPDVADLVAAPPPDRNVYLEDTRLPATVPPWLGDLARQVTDGAQSNYERAVRLQQWFREDGGFTYSVARSNEGNGTDELQYFLGTRDGSRVGYCEQFAAAMAVLARELKIPARVAVGFLRPDRVGNDAWVYTSHDLHAWPELYFEGAGWLRFEPTPSSEDVPAPAYTTGRVPAPDTLPTPSVSASAETRDKPTAHESDPAAATPQDGGNGLPPWLGWAGLALLAACLLAVPRLVRELVRRRRLSGALPGGVAEGAWAEIRATALDLRLGWDDGVTLRRRARALVPALAPAGHGVAGPDGDARTPVEALERLVLLLERVRFSRTGQSGLPEDVLEEMPALAAVVTDAMRRGAKPGAQRRATWLPASLWSGRQRGAARRYAASGDRLGELDRVSL